MDAQRRAFLQLKPPHDTTFNSDMRRHSGGRACLRATCGDVLKEIHSWVESDAGRLLWLHGPAGSGKSTLSHTIAEYYSRPNKNLLAASFFFSRGYLSNSDILFQTIAFQLGLQHSVLQQAIASAIIDDMTIFDTKANHLERLILDPVSEVAPFLPSRLVVVIDALDECNSDDAASDVIKLLATSLSSYSPHPLRFLVTCRPEKHLYNLFMQPSISPVAYPLDLSAFDARRDISLYITDELGELLARTLPFWSNFRRDYSSQHQPSSDSSNPHLRSGFKKSDQMAFLGLTTCTTNHDEGNEGCNFAARARLLSCYYRHHHSTCIRTIVHAGIT